MTVPVAEDTKEKRRSARLIAAFVPGAGLARIGYARAGWAGYLLTRLAILSLLWVAFAPGYVSIVSCLALIAAATLFSVVESIAVGHLPIRDETFPSTLRRRVFPHVLNFAILSITAMIALFATVGQVFVRGKGMSPTLAVGDRLMYHRKVDAGELERGRLLLFRTSPLSSWGVPGTNLLGRILAVPGDRLSIRNGVYLVNGREVARVAATAKLPVALDVPAEPKEITVPADQFFVVPDDPAASFDSRIYSWVRRSDVIATKLIRVWRMGYDVPR